MIFETKRLILRPTVEDDALDIFEYSKNPNIGINAGWNPHENLNDTLETMKLYFLNRDTVWGIVLKETNKIIGQAGMIEDPKRDNQDVRMLGYAIAEEHWGKGIMTEALTQIIKYGLEVLKLPLISAYCYPSNIRSKKILSKFGFKLEGVLKYAEKLWNGQILDNECWALENPNK